MVGPRKAGRGDGNLLDLRQREPDVQRGQAWVLPAGCGRNRRGPGAAQPEGVVSVNVDAPCSKPVLSNLRFTAAAKPRPSGATAIDLAVDATPGNCGLISSQLTYNWTLLAPAGQRGGAEVVELRGAFRSSPTWPRQFHRIRHGDRRGGQCVQRRHADHFRIHLWQEPDPRGDFGHGGAKALRRPYVPGGSRSGPDHLLRRRHLRLSGPLSWAVLVHLERGLVGAERRVRVSTTRTVRP